ncbi:hypothetical protein [Pseudogemmobacter faecipullorum]|uniref:PLD phosphodiesterase domain-containing protein n=1 Tax=Pseudogemmobacter faecipullorum TaxID=2755041 RepID=A0ABS8CRN0_9RHOB|nr:hypothetical protein [Pseudogemmobacter faecipullorum]MCB5412061.1 hypothetical protein [Pseudogemmobacter faecipullorum]
MTALLDLFAPPPGYTGHFGWICGFTADGRVMREIADRFTIGAGSFATTFQRPALLLMTDHASPQITADRAPGMYHVTLAPSWRQRFRGRGIFHAKVALLHFSGTTSKDPAARRDIFRLVVSTGNWTRETLERNIDLFWSVEFPHSDPAAESQNLADIMVARDMFTGLQPHLSLYPWAAASGGEAMQVPYADTLRLLNALKAPPGVTPRFFHSLDQPLRKPLLERFGGSQSEPLTILGSGFFAGGDPAPVRSSQPQGAEAFLRELVSDLSGQDEAKPVFTVLNPDACQGLATAAAALKARRWRFFRPRFPDGNDGSQGKLHAKFIYRGKKDRLKGQLYIGSGNLTPAGMGASTGTGLWNFEAGVVIPVDKQGTPDLHLPYSPNEDIDLNTELKAGGPFEMANEFSGDCPLTHFRLIEDSAGLWLEPRPVPSDFRGISLSHSGGNWQPLSERIALDPERLPPALVRLRWSSGGDDTANVAVPVLNERGLQVVPEAQHRRLEDVWDALMQMAATGREPEPEPPEDDEDDEGRRNGSRGQSATARPATYATRRLMAVITALGEVQAEMPAGQTRLWANRLIEHGRSLARTEGDVLRTLKDMQLNPFRHLGRAEFMPLGLNNEEVRILHDAHAEAARLWGVRGFAGFDGVLS